MLKIANAIKGKQEGRFKKIAEKEAKMRSSKMSDADKQRMRKDFLGQVYIYEDEVKEGELTPEEMKELKELEALEKQGKI